MKPLILCTSTPGARADGNRSKHTLNLEQE
jgi:hypothetical protein